MKVKKETKDKKEKKAETMDCRPLTRCDPQAARDRQNRVLTLLKAALNHAWRERPFPSDETPGARSSRFTRNVEMRR